MFSPFAKYITYKQVSEITYRHISLLSAEGARALTPFRNFSFSEILPLGDHFLLFYVTFTDHVQTHLYKEDDSEATVIDIYRMFCFLCHTRDDYTVVTSRYRLEKNTP